MLPEIDKHPQAKLYPGELVTIGILFTLKSGSFRAFYRWLNCDYGNWFSQGQLPDRTRLQRLLKTHQGWTSGFLAESTFFTVIDSYPIGLFFPVNQKRKPDRVAE